MVNPLLTVAVLLGAAFLMPLADRLGKTVGRLLFLASLAFALWVPLGFLPALSTGAPAIEVATAGFRPPLSISFVMGWPEALVLTAASLALLLGGIYFVVREKDGFLDRMLFLILALGVTGLILTRDLFNLFVFLELASLGVYGLIGRSGDRSLQAGFKYMIAGGIASIVFLIGVVYLYRLTGTLNIDGMTAARELLTGRAGQSALFFLALALMIELKPFPANGWALDAYQAAPSSLGALLSSAHAAAAFMAILKVTPLMGEALMGVLAGVGMITFVASNLMGLKQTNVKRMLGYSSTGQVGLLLFAWFSLARAGFASGAPVVIIVMGFLLTHLFAKAGLFWMAGRVDAADRNAWSGRIRGVLPAAIMGVLVMALIGLPPFPSFFAKWELVNLLAAQKSWVWMVLLFVGSLFEAFYLFRWFAQAVKPAGDDQLATANAATLVVGSETDLADDAAPTDRPASLPTGSGWALIPAILVSALGLFSGFLLGVFDFPGLRDLSPTAIASIAPLAGGLLMLLLAWLPGRLRGLIALAITAAAAWFVWPVTVGLNRIFAMVFLVGGAVYLFASLYAKGRRPGHWAFSLMTILALASLVFADRSENSLAFLVAWEIMAAASALLILRGRNAAGPSRTYLLFGLGGGYLLMAALALMGVYPGGGTSLPATITTAAVILLALAFLIKTGALGLHVWLPGAYAEADDDTSGFLSGVLSKVGVWALMIFAIRLVPGGGGTAAAEVLGWVGLATAFAGTFIAVFQEDIKYTLAWSSMGQLGYIVLAFSLLNFYGWTTALYISVIHLIFKGMLFFAVAGVVLRVKTRLMYKMGGLIRPMPITFISVLMAIIALSGVPPLAGFGAKWLLYTSLLEAGRPLQAALAFFASTIAFLYLFRLIHSIFLGQRKDDSAGIKEAPFWLIAPQVILMMALMAISSFPSILLKPLMAAVGTVFPADLAFEGSTLTGALGYWNGRWVMYVTMGVFMIPLIWLFIIMRTPRRVGQFNVVFAAERPDRPETTHYAHNFFAPYRKALGFLAKPVGRVLWNGVAEGTGAVASMFRRIYTGNGQTYAIYIVLFAAVLAALTGVIL